MNDDAPVKRRMGGWKLLGLLAGTLLLLLGGGGWWWYISDGDLHDFRVRARAAGVAVTWEEAGLVIAPADRLAIWNELGTLIDGKTLSSRQENAKLSARKPFAADLDDLRAHHAAFDATRLARLLELVDRLGDEPLVLHTKHSFGTPMPEIGRYRSLARLLQERIWLAEAQDVPRECRRLLGVCATMDSPTILADLIRTSVVELTLSGIVERLDVLRERDPGIAELLAGLDARGTRSLLRGVSGELILAHSLCTDPRQIPASETSLGSRLALRAGRHELLSRELEWLLLLRGNPDAQSILRHSRTFAAIPGLRWDPRYLLSRMTLPAFEGFVSMSIRCQLRASLMAAELRGSAWPPDCFAAGSPPLHRWERDGRLMGAYTVDIDGVDDGGDTKKDRYFPLYGPREAPTTSP